MSRNRLTWREAASLSIGDRELPLEADVGVDVDRSHPSVGGTVEVSPIAGGTLLPKRGKDATIIGVISRFGQVVGYEVLIEGSSWHGAVKDFYVGRDVLEDLQPPTALSAALVEGLSHWGQPRDYWATRTDGLESFCFELASVTPRAMPVVHPWGWQFFVPDPMPGDHAVVDCRAVQHDNFWTLATCVYPEREGRKPLAPIIEDHWARVFSWSYAVAQGMVLEGFPWQEAAQGIKIRAAATTRLLIPLVRSTLQRVVEARQQLTGEEWNLPSGGLSVGFCDIRLQPGKVGLLEPPTDRRPYAVMSVAPSAVLTAQKKPGYLENVILHECIHLTVASRGGPPHNDLFNEMASLLELPPQYRD